MSSHRLTATPASIRWGHLPNATACPAVVVDSGEQVTFDLVSHEGILEDQGRDPIAFFGGFGIPPDQVLADAIELAGSDLAHDPSTEGPHVVLGPVAVRGAKAGDVLEVVTERLDRRADYGVISNRHGRGALPGEMPSPDIDGPVCTLATVEGGMGAIALGGGRRVRFPLAPFVGLMGVAAATDEPVHSVPPGSHGGNLDINLIGVGSRLYLPLQCDGALFYAGDPHFAQGDGEVALTAFEAPLRATVTLVLHSGGAARALAETLGEPFAETADSWILVGLDCDLNEAMRQATRQAVAFLGVHARVPAGIALAYLSAAADFEVSQVVDGVKGVHCVIRKADFDDVSSSITGPWEAT